MKIRTPEGGVVEVDEETGKRMVADHGWKRVRRTSTPAQTEETQTEE